MSFPPPSRLIHIKDKERRERKDKNTGGGSEKNKSHINRAYRANQALFIKTFPVILALAVSGAAKSGTKA
jgi:hypothetical protein